MTSATIITLANIAHASLEDAWLKSMTNYRRIMANGDPDDAESDQAFELRMHLSRLVDQADEAAAMVEAGS